MKKPSPHYKVLASQIIVHIICFGGLYLYWDPQWLWVALIGTTLIGGYGMGIYAHRYLSHNSFKVNPKVEMVLNFLAIMGLQGPPMTWAANHVNHHRHSDKELDPHPAYDWFGTWFWLSVGKRLKIDVGTTKRLSRKRMHRITTQYYFKIFWSVFILSLLIDPRITIYFFAIPVVYTFHTSSFTNTVLHKFGYRNFDTPDTSTNLPIPFLLECCHNNHHNDPSNYNQAVKWYEFDLYKHMIDIIKVNPR